MRLKRPGILRMRAALHEHRRTRTEWVFALMRVVDHYVDRVARARLAEFAVHRSYRVA